MKSRPSRLPRGLEHHRVECLARLKRCLGEMVVGGVETTIPLFQDLLSETDIVEGRYHIHWLEDWLRGEAR